MVDTGTAAAVTYSRHLSVESIDRFCVIPERCLSTEPVLPFLVFLMTGLVALLLVATIAHIKSAEGLLAMERDRTQAERDAFREFAARVATLEVSGSVAAAGESGGLLGRTRSPDAQLQRIEDVYRETVMATPHYEEEYDEPIRVNLAAEFSEEIAAAVLDGDAFTPQLKQALVGKSREAVAQREQFLGQLSREAATLSDAATSLSEIEEELEALDDRPLHRRTFEDLLGLWESVGALDARCRDILEARQREIHKLAGTRGADEPTIQEYVYQSLPVTYPVLSSGTALARTIAGARRRIAGAVSRHP